MNTNNEQSVGQTQGVAAGAAGAAGFVIDEWLKHVIEGPSGMNAYERHEMVTWNESDRMAAARWVIGCLANPRCAGSAEMLRAIQERREERLANTKIRTRGGKTMSQNEPTSPALCVAPRSLRSSDKSVRETTVTAKLTDGDVRVECKRNGVLFGFPLAVWPASAWEQMQWVERLTPWWVMSAPDWSPQAQRLRDSCRAAINKLSKK